MERLTSWGVKRVYGYAGDGHNPVLGAFQRATDGSTFIQTKHEESAAFIPDG